MDFQDEESKSGGTAGNNPFNRNILKGGKVDPRSKLYQRSVAGRQSLEDFVRDLWDQGKDEKDVFMQAVNSLMNRGHGYVGAYLDSKNPGRRYTEPQAMKIADEVMSKAGVGSNPGARLTPAKDDEERESRKADRTQRREARKAGPAPAPGVKAKPVGQQRKEGKRPGTGEPAGGTDREGLGAPETGPRSEWQKTLKDRIDGEASTQDVLAAFQKQYQSKLPRSPKGKAKQEGKKQDLRDSIAGDSGLPKTEQEVDQVSAPEEDEGRLPADPVAVGNKFKELVEDSIKANLPVNKNSLEDMIQETIEILEDDYEVDPEQARAAIFRRFNGKLINGQRVQFDPSSAPEERKAPERQQTTPEPEQVQQTPPEPSSPVERKNSQPGQFEGKVVDDITPEDIGPEEEGLFRKYKSAMESYRSRGGLTGREEMNYKSGLDWAASRGLPTSQESEKKILESRQQPEPEPEQPSETPRPVTSKGGFKAPAQQSRGGGGGFGGQRTPKSAIDAAKKAISESANLTPEQVVEKFKQGNLFGGRGFDTESSSTNPLEGGSTPNKEAVSPPASSPSRPPEQKTFLSRAKGKETQILPSMIQVPKPAQGVEDAEAYTKQLQDAGIPSDKILKAVKESKLPAPPKPSRPSRPAARTPRKNSLLDPLARMINKGREAHNKSAGGKLFQVSEEGANNQMSYEEFSQSIRSLMR